MAELAGNQVGASDEVPGGAIAPGAGLGGLQEGVDALDRAVGKSGVKAVPDARAS
jgi:hypothetical protein